MKYLMYAVLDPGFEEFPDTISLQKRMPASYETYKLVTVEVIEEEADLEDIFNRG